MGDQNLPLSLEIVIVFGVALLIFIFVLLRQRENEETEDIETGNSSTLQTQPQQFVNVFVRIVTETNTNPGIIAQKEKNKKLIEWLQVAQEKFAIDLDEKTDFSSECGICLDVWEGGGEEEEKLKIWTLPGCKHMYHKECICGWLKSSGTTCPICRSDILNYTAR